MINIRHIQREDHDQWLPLWRENGLHQVGDNVTAETWRRICHPKEAVFALGAFDEDNLAGFLSYVLHPVTGFIEPACYMQDLYIAEQYRRCGYAKRLVWELHNVSKKQGWSRLYWFAEQKNEAVQALYKNLGVKVSFDLFMLPTT